MPKKYETVEMLYFLQVYELLVRIHTNNYYLINR